MLPWTIGKWGNRTMRGSISVAASASTSSSTVLYNSSVGPEVLAVWQVVPYSVTSAIEYGMNSVQGVPTGFTSGGLIESLYTGETPRAGVLYGGNPSTQPGQSYTWGTNASLQLVWNPNRPIALLRPGWGLQITAGHQNQIMRVSYVWSSIPADEMSLIAPPQVEILLPQQV